MKIVFMGTPDFAQESLQKIYESNYEISAVVTKEDKEKGRGMKLIYSPVKEYAISKNMYVLQPKIIKENNKFIEEIKKINPDLICVVAYGIIIPKEILEIPKFGSINLHASLLPKYRGAAPIQWAILNGDKLTGVTTMYMNEGLDSGDILLKKEVEIGENETTGELWKKLSKIGADLLLDTIKEIEKGSIIREKQSDNFTKAPSLKKEIAKINWENQTSIQIKNLVRGLNPIMGAYSYLKNKKVKFWKIEILEYNKLKLSDDIKPGTVVYSNNKEGMYVKTIDSIISVLEIQGENSRRMNICEFLRGNNIMENEIFS